MAFESRPPRQWTDFCPKEFALTGELFAFFDVHRPCV